MRTFIRTCKHFIICFLQTGWLKQKVESCIKERLVRRSSAHRDDEGGWRAGTEGRTCMHVLCINSFIGCHIAHSSLRLPGSNIHIQCIEGVWIEPYCVLRLRLLSNGDNICYMCARVENSSIDYHHQHNFVLYLMRNFCSDNAISSEMRCVHMINGCTCVRCTHILHVIINNRVVLFQRPKTNEIQPFEWLSALQFNTIGKRFLMNGWISFKKYTCIQYKYKYQPDGLTFISIHSSPNPVITQ